MARRRSVPRDDVELFPFLDILACLIGCLTLMITALVLEMDNSEVAHAEEAERVYARLDARRAELAALEQQAQALQTSDDAQQVELAELRRELAAERAKVAEAIKRNQQPSEIEPPRADPGDHERQVARIKDQIRQARRQVDERKAALKDREPSDAPPRVEIHPSGSGVDLKPVFVECHKGGITLFETSTRQHRIPSSKISTDAKYLDTLKRVAKDPNSSIIFLIRGDALSVYNAASGVAKDHYARHGKLPLVGEGEVDLSQFEK